MVVDVAVADTDVAGARQLQALESFFTVLEQAVANAGSPVLAVTVLLVKVAQKAEAEAGAAEKAAAQASLDPLSQPSTNGTSSPRRTARNMTSDSSSVKHFPMVESRGEIYTRRRESAEEWKKTRLIETLAL